MKARVAINAPVLRGRQQEHLRNGLPGHVPEAHETPGPEPDGLDGVREVSARFQLVGPLGARDAEPVGAQQDDRHPVVDVA